MRCGNQSVVGAAAGNTPQFQIPAEVGVESVATLDHEWVLPAEDDLQYPPSEVEEQAFVDVGEGAVGKAPLQRTNIGNRVPARAMRFDANYGSGRMQAVTECWGGMCEMQGREPYDVSCPSCHRQAHSQCLRLDPTVIGNLSVGVCPECNAQDVFGCGLDVLSENLIADFHKLSISSMGESVTKSKSDKFKNLLSAVSRYEASRGITQEQISLESPQLFALLLRYVGHEEAHPASMEKHLSAMTDYLLRRQKAGASGSVWCKGVMVEGKPAPWTLGTIVQEHYRELKAQLHYPIAKGDPVPWPLVEHASVKLSRPVQHMQEHIRVRVAMVHEMDVLGGFRITELVESGSAHGMCATDVLITTFDPHQLAVWPSWAEAAELSKLAGASAKEVPSMLDPGELYAVYFGLEDYKLHEEEASIAVASPTQTGRNVVAPILKYCEATGMQLKVVTTEDGRRGVSIDYYVLRVDLSPPEASAAGARLAMALDSIIEELDLTETQRKWSKQRFRQCWKLANKKKLFFNFAGGTRKEAEYLLFRAEDAAKRSWRSMASVKASMSSVNDEFSFMEDWWLELGIKIKEGPLVRATQGKWYTHMPLQYASAAKDLTAQWKAAEIAVYGEQALRLVSHSARRAATHRARVKILAAGFPVALIDELIDRHFRWKPDTGGQRKAYTGHLSIEQRLMVTLFM